MILINIVQRFKCTACNQIIEPEKGKLIQGNIYQITEDVEARIGLVGSQSQLSTELHNVECIPLCNECLIHIINLEDDNKELVIRNSSIITTE